MEKVTQIINEAIAKKLSMKDKPKPKMPKSNPRSPKKCTTPTEELIKKVEGLHEVFKRYDQRKKLQLETVKRELAENDKRLRKQEMQQREYLLLIRKTEAERRAKEIRRIKKIALAHVFSILISLFKIDKA